MRCSRAIDFLLSHRIRRHFLDDFDQRLPGVIKRGVLSHLRPENQHARFPKLTIVAPDCAGLPGLYQCLVQAPRRGVAEDGSENVDRSEVRVRAGRHVVDSEDLLNVADAAQRHAALAILSRLHGVGSF